MQKYFALLICLTFAATTSACATESARTPAAASFDGLERVNARRFDAAWIRSGTDFSGYKRILIAEPELAFRTPNRAERQFPLSAEQKSRFAVLLRDSLNTEISDQDVLKITDAEGPDTLRLSVRVQDIVTSISPHGASAGGRSSLALAALGEATLVLELLDSESGEILARAVDTRVSEGVAIFTEDGPLTRWEDVEKVCEKWGANARRGLERLLRAD